jgi:predicted RNase H-like HicB family nuclease
MISLVNEMAAYQRAALKRAVIQPMPDASGFKATIPGFKGLIVFGETKQETRKELQSVLEGWIAVALRRGMGLPALSGEVAGMAISH